VGVDPSGIPSSPNAYQAAPSAIGVNQYVLGINASGTALLFATYLTSGSGNETPAGIAVDSSGDVYVAGATRSPSYPTTPGALEPELEAQEPNATTGYVSAVNATGTALVFSTFFGGSVSDSITSMSLDQTRGLIYLSGNATSPDVPGVLGIYRNCVPQSFVTALTTDGTAVTRTQTVSPVVIGDNPSIGIGASDTVWVLATSLEQVDIGPQTLQSHASSIPPACL
jgi:hypothetical protein